MWTCSNRIARRASLLEREADVEYAFGLAAGVPLSVTFKYVVNRQNLTQLGGLGIGACPRNGRARRALRLLAEVDPRKAPGD